MEPKIVYQDNQLLVLDKPASWIVNEAKTTGNTPVVQTWIYDKFDFETAKESKYRSGIVHRLDKETSGALLVAKTKESFKFLQSQFKKRQVEKTYLALLHGKMSPEAGSVNAPVGRLPWNRERFGVLPGGRKALTRYEVKDYYCQKEGKKTNYFTLAIFFPKTGRTHQIRIHAKYLGYPIVSDSFYAGRKTAKKDLLWCPRLFLHAEKIGFFHPQSKKKKEFKVKLEKDLEKALNKLEKLER